MRTLTSILVILLLAAPTFADNYKAGSAGAQFLKVGVGSRYLGVADAAVATVDDAYAAYWNPAGLASVEDWSMAFTNVNYLLDIDLNYFAMAHRFEQAGVFALSVTVLSMGEQEITTIEEQEGTGDFYSASSYAIGLSFARNLTNRFAFGASVKYVGEEIGEVDSKGFGVDFGTMLYTGFNSFRIGMSITNMGPDLEFSGNGLKISSGLSDAELSTRPYNLPMTFRVGMAYDVPLNDNALVIMSAELTDPNDAQQKGSLGAELGYREQFFLRGGYKIRYDEQSLALGGGLSTPVGTDTRLIIDYAWQDFGRLESTQRFSVGFSF